MTCRVTLQTRNARNYTVCWTTQHTAAIIYIYIYVFKKKENYRTLDIWNTREQRHSVQFILRCIYTYITLLCVLHVVFLYMYKDCLSAPFLYNLLSSVSAVARCPVFFADNITKQQWQLPFGSLLSLSLLIVTQVYIHLVNKNKIHSFFPFQIYINK